jgi:hypothetical protein
MASTQIIRPSSTVQNTPPWTITGAPGTVHGVLADESDSTYVGASATASAVTRGPNHTPPADHERHQSRVRFRIAATSGTPKFRGMGGAGGPLSSMDVSPPTTITTYTAPWQFCNQATASAVSEFDPIRLSSTGNVRCYAMYVDVDCRVKPTFDIKGFQGGVEIPDGGTFDATNRPRFQFENCLYDGLVARAWTAKIRTPGGTVIWQTQGAGKPTSVSPSMGNYLDNGIYVAEFTISSTIRGSAEYVSNVVTYDFSVDFETTESQIISVTPDCRLGGYIIEVQVGDVPAMPVPERPSIASASLFGAWDARSLDEAGLDHGDTATAWVSESGTKVFDTTITTKPTYIQGGQPGSLNGMSGLKFESGQCFRGNLGVMNPPRTWFYVIHTPPHDDNIFTYMFGVSGLGWIHLASWNSPANQWYFMTHQYTGPHVGFSEAGFHDSPHLFTFVQKTPNAFVRVDQSQKGTASPVLDAGNGVLQLGEPTNIAGPNVIFYELLAYEGEVSASDIDLIEDYLYAKWFAPLTPAEIPDMTVVRHDLTTGGLTPVRGLTNLEPNQNYRMVDYEAPINHEVAYWLYEGGGAEVAVPIGGGTLPTQLLQDACGTDQMYLRWLFDPSVIASEFCLGPIGELAYAPRSGVFPVIGRSDPVVVNDRQETARGTLRLIGQTTEEVNALRKLLTRDAQPTLLTIPDSYMVGKEGQLYFQPLAVKEEWINPDNRIPQHALTVDYVEIAPPALTAPLEPPPVGMDFGNGGWIVWSLDPPDGTPHGDPADRWSSFQALLSSGNTFESALYE